jgi:predicted RNase H-like nuclease (RuvC/YqgF family)
MVERDEARAEVARVLSEIRYLTYECDELRRGSSNLITERDEARAELETAKKALAEARALTAAEKTRADQNYADWKNVRAAVKALEDWRADVTAALQRSDGAPFADVPKHVRDLVGERNDLKRQLDAGQPRIATRCPACGGSTLFVGHGGHLTCSRLKCPNPSVADEIKRVADKCDEYRQRWNGLDVEREKWAALARENEDLRQQVSEAQRETELETAHGRQTAATINAAFAREKQRADKAEKALAEATEWRPMREHIAAPTIVAWRGEGGRVGVYGACNFGPLSAHQQSGALGWLPIPPYRAKEGQ